MESVSLTAADRRTPNEKQRKRRFWNHRVQNRRFLLKGGMGRAGPLKGHTLYSIKPHAKPQAARDWF
jgi:hypothetical protein